MSSVKNVCVRQARSPWRRKKSCLLMTFCCILFYGFMQVVQFNEGYTALRPLTDARSEAKRLLKYITHYHYQCNTTVQIGNRSHWPICVEKDVGLDLDSRDAKIMYTVGSNVDFIQEKSLAANHSFQIYIISPADLPAWSKQINGTFAVKTNMVPNDPADFSRNSYGQKTLNTIMTELHHDHVDILKLVSVEAGVNMWEVLHFMNYDNLLLNVEQFHLAMYIEKLDEDYLYNWYRALYELFYKEGFRLYHTSTRDSLCLQVTLMESCIYYLSFVRNPGPKIFVLHPPADFGTTELEEERLLHYLSTPQVECKMEIIGSPNDQVLHFTSAASAPTNNHVQWDVCSMGRYELFVRPCTVFRFRTSNDHVLEEKLINEGCSVFTVEPVTRPGPSVKSFRMHSHQPRGRSRSTMSRTKSLDEVLHYMQESGDISLLEIDLIGYEWEVLGFLLDSGVLANVSQIVASVQLSDDSLGRHPTVFRSRYSELKRLEMQGFDIFHTSLTPLRASSTMSLISKTPRALSHPFSTDCCYKLGFLRKQKPDR